MSRCLLKILLPILLSLSIITNVYLLTLYMEKKSKMSVLYNNSVNTYIDEFSQIYNKEDEIGSKLTYETLTFISIKLHSARAAAFSADMALGTGANLTILVSHFLERINNIQTSYKKNKGFTQKDYLEYKQIFDEMRMVKVVVNIDIIKDVAAKEKVTKLLNELEQNTFPLKNVN